MGRCFIFVSFVKSTCSSLYTGGSIQPCAFSEKGHARSCNGGGMSFFGHAAATSVVGSIHGKVSRSHFSPRARSADTTFSHKYKVVFFWCHNLNEDSTGIGPITPARLQRRLLVYESLSFLTGRSGAILISINAITPPPWQPH